MPFFKVLGSNYLNEEYCDVFVPEENSKLIKAF